MLRGVCVDRDNGVDRVDCWLDGGETRADWGWVCKEERESDVEDRAEMRCGLMGW